MFYWPHSSYFISFFKEKCARLQRSQFFHGCLHFWRVPSFFIRVTFWTMSFTSSSVQITQKEIHMYSFSKLHPEDLQGSNELGGNQLLTWGMLPLKSTQLLTNIKFSVDHGSVTVSAISVCSEVSDERTSLPRTALM